MTKYFNSREEAEGYLKGNGWRVATSGRWISADGFLTATFHPHPVGGCQVALDFLR